MSLQHRIWELVTMITQRSEQQQTMADETILSNPRTDDTVATTAEQNHEAEISRLTWAFLDGKATAEERHRLAELVNEQHRERGD